MNSHVKKITFTKAKELIDSVPNILILDVREEEEYILGHIENAVLFPVDDINKDTAKNIIGSFDTPLVVYCKSGRRATDAAVKLDLLGYTTIYNLGGVISWPYGLEV